MTISSLDHLWHALNWLRWVLAIGIATTFGLLPLSHFLPAEPGTINYFAGLSVVILVQWAIIGVVLATWIWWILWAISIVVMPFRFFRESAMGRSTAGRARILPMKIASLIFAVVSLFLILNS